MYIEENINRVKAEIENLNCIVYEKDDLLTNSKVVAKMSGGEKILLDDKAYSDTEILLMETNHVLQIWRERLSDEPALWGGLGMLSETVINLQKLKRFESEDADFCAKFFDGSCQKICECVDSNRAKYYADNMNEELIKQGFFAEHKSLLEDLAANH